MIFFMFLSEIPKRASNYVSITKDNFLKKALIYNFYQILCRASLNNTMVMWAPWLNNIIIIIFIVTIIIIIIIIIVWIALSLEPPSFLPDALTCTYFWTGVI